MFVLHQAALTHLALARCDVLSLPDAAAQAARSFVAADRFGMFEGLACLLDWCDLSSLTQAWCPNGRAMIPRTASGH